MARVVKAAYPGGGMTRRGLTIGLVAVLVVGFLVLLAAAWPFRSTPADKVGVSYGGGLMEGAHYQKLVNPGHGMFFNGWGDRLYLYPTTQRTYIVDANPAVGERPGPDAVHATTRDSQDVRWELAVYFKVNVSKLQHFHEQIGLKTQAFTDRGWDVMLDQYLRPQIENSLVNETRKYTVAQVNSDQRAVNQIQAHIGTYIKERVNTSLGDQYLCGPTYDIARPAVCPDFTLVIKKPTIPKVVQDAYEQVAASNLQVQVRQNEVLQNKAQAQSIRELQKALSSSSGYNYVLLKAVEGGKVQFWVLPQGANVTVPGLQAQPPAQQGR